MKRKAIYLLSMIGSLSCSTQLMYAHTAGIKLPVDSTKQAPIHIKVKDRYSSKPVDSVLVTMGQEKKYSVNGIVTFENNPDSVIILAKPGYNRVGKKVSGNSLTVFMTKTSELHQGFYTVPNNLLADSEMITSAVRSIRGDQLLQVHNRDIVSGLQFFVPSLLQNQQYNEGSNPNSEKKFSLRGSSGFPYAAYPFNKNSSQGLQVNPSVGDYRAANVTTNSSPTFLVDGVQVSAQTVRDMDMQRILQIDIINDAISAASYGMRGGNGLISITTKRPTERFQISFHEQWHIATANLSSFKPLSAKEKLTLEKASGLFEGDLAGLYQQRYNAAQQENIQTDWLSVPLHNAISSKHSLNFAAGNDDIYYGLNASYNNVGGVMKGSHRNSMDLGAYFSGRIGQLIFNNQFSYLGVSAQNSAYGTFDNYLRMNAYWRTTDPFTGKYQKLVEQYDNNGTMLSFKNPAYNATLSTTDDHTYAQFSNVTNLTWLIGSGFKLNAMASISKQNDERHYFLPPSHTEFADVSADNLFTRGLYRYTPSSFFDVQGSARVQYFNEFGKHKLAANLGQTVIQTSSESEAVAVRGFAVDRLAEISFGNAYSIAKPISGKINTRYASTFANASYAYDNRYVLSAAGSIDYYSNINQPTSSAGLGLAWNMHQEDFLKDISWIDRFTVSGNLGTSSNQDYLAYTNRTSYLYYTDQQYIPLGSGIASIGIGLGAFLNSYGNKNLKAPQTKKTEISWDATLFNNRLSWFIKAYKQENDNMILPVSMPSYLGFQSYSHYNNYGSIENKGIEAGINGRIINGTKDQLKVDLMANFWRGTDKITGIGPYTLLANDYNNSAVRQTTIQPQYQIGYSPYAIWAVKSLGIDAQTGDELFETKGGTTTNSWNAADKVFAGKLTPDWTGSLGLSLAYKDWSFGSYFTFVNGAQVYNQTLANIENATVHEQLDGRAIAIERWTAGNANAQHKALYHSPTYATTRLVENDNRFECTAISLGYQLPSSLAKKIRAKQCNFGLMLNNAFAVGGADMQRGYYYPYQRNYSFSINANF